MFCQDGPILATDSFVFIWQLDVLGKENRSYHAESRELNIPLVYVCRVEIESICKRLVALVLVGFDRFWFCMVFVKSNEKEKGELIKM